MNNEIDRIEIEVPNFPHSLRAFVEDTVRNDRAFRCMVESPVTALLNAGVPIIAENLTERDCARIVQVVSNIRRYVVAQDYPATVRFEDIFGVKESKSWGWDDTTVEWKQDAEIAQHSDSEEAFSGLGWIRHKDLITAPLISPADLTELLIRIDEQVAMRQQPSLAS